METSEQSDEYVGYKVWPSDWRVVHFMVTSEDTIPQIVAPLHDETFPWELCFDGDCGLVWGEKKTLDCQLWHVQIYTHSDNIHRVLRCLRSKPDELGGVLPKRPDKRSYYCVVTDPNAWSEKVNTIVWPTGRKCSSGIH
jgi:hypothetical protein